MRFILNFFLFGFLFYLIYVFFPEAFTTLVSWANHVYDFFKDLVNTGINSMSPKKAPAGEETHQTMAVISLFRWF